jgi:uncharacterized protein (DUF697 family)
MAQEPTGSGKAEKKDPAAVEAAPGSATTERTPEQRDEEASKLVDRFALWGGGAGLIPIPVVDVALVGGVQIQMLRKLSQLYGVAFSENRGKALIASLAGSMIPATSGMGAASVMKSVPVIGTAIGALVMPTLSAGATYAIGKTFIQHFRSGGTLLDFDPPDYKEFIKAQKEKWTSKSATETAPAAPAAASTRAPSKASA